MEVGKLLKIAAKKELKPSAKIPPCALFKNTGPSTGSPEINELAVISPNASTAVTK